MMTRTQLNVLKLIAERPRETSRNTRGDYVSGTTVKALATRGLVEGGYHDSKVQLQRETTGQLEHDFGKYTYRITPLGEAVLKHGTLCLYCRHDVFAHDLAWGHHARRATCRRSALAALEARDPGRQASASDPSLVRQSALTPISPRAPALQGPCQSDH